MATTKNRPDNGSVEQRGKEGSLVNTTGRTNPNTLPGDRATNEETRNAVLPGAQRKGAETTQMGTNDRKESVAARSSFKDGERIDLKTGANRMTDQNASGEGDMNERDEDDEDHAELPGVH